MGHEPHNSTPTPMGGSDSTSSKSIATKGNFTMVYLDLDDTLIPTTIRNSLRVNFGFELFKIVNTTKLQSDIISSLKKIKLTLSHHNSSNPIHLCLISNATQPWIDDMLTAKTAHFPILGQYMKDENIPMLSAVDTARKYLRDQFGDEEAQNVINTQFKDNYFMYKYTTFGACMNKMERKLNMKCDKVISFGDGECEHQAIQIYSNRNPDVVTLNIKFRKAPTISQLQSEWKYIDTCFDGVIKHIMKNKGINRNKYFEIDIDERFKHDNNILCTGKYQLNAITSYFNIFMKLLERSTKETKTAAISAVCKIVAANLKANNKSSPRGVQCQEMVRIAYKNKEFNKSMSELLQNRSILMVNSNKSQ